MAAAMEMSGFCCIFTATKVAQIPHDRSTPVLFAMCIEVIAIQLVCSLVLKLQLDGRRIICNLICKTPRLQSFMRRYTQMTISHAEKRLLQESIAVIFA